MSRHSVARRWAFARWPANDQDLWIRNCTPGDPFDDPCYGADLSAATLQLAAKSYRFWLDFLDGMGWLDPQQEPLQRVTPQRLREYFRSIKRNGNADYTIIARFSGLTIAMKILAPGKEVGWIRKPFGPTIYAMLPKAKRSLIVPDSGIVFKWAIGIMTKANVDDEDRTGLCDYRDGLILALLACRARRLRSMALLRFGTELLREGNRYRIELTASQVKTKRRDVFVLPTELTSFIDRYLNEVRPILLGHNSHQELWISVRGHPLTHKSIQHLVHKRTLKRFGTGFGPHRCRHSIATTSALRASDCPGLAAAVLGISKGVVEASYNRAGQVAAALTLASIVQLRRSKALADRARIIDNSAGRAG